MKKNIFLIGVCLLSFFACKKSEFIDLIVAGEHPFSNTTGGNVHKTFSFDDKKAVIIKVPKFSEWNIFYRKEEKESFLTNYCVSDCNEKLDKYAWSKDGLYFAMLIKNSNRYPNGTRLFLFDFNDDIIKRKVDVKDRVIKSFRFDEKAFYYSDSQNVETKVNL